jgi:hypothetical protein
MSILKNPNELKKTLTVSGLIYGQPGIGKSTLALSAPNPVVIDADKGMKRVEPRFRVPSLPLDSYKDLLALLETNELDGFQTIVFDTAGKLLERMGDYVMETNPKNRQGDGSLSQKGWGAVKSEFQKLVRTVQGKNKNIIFIAHEREEKDGEAKKLRPDISGSSGKDIVKELDFMGYYEKRGSKRVISFNPDETFYAKNSLKLPQYLEVADTDANPNDFITKHIIERTAARAAEEDVENQKYAELVATLTASVDKVKDVKTANDALAVVSAADAIWDSHRVVKAKLQEKVKALGIEYSKEKSCFVKKPNGKAEEAVLPVIAEAAAQVEAVA